MRLEVFMVMKIQFFWVMILCSDVVEYHHFREPYCPEDARSI
jgi:hypothetical protein